MPSREPLLEIAHTVNVAAIGPMLAVTIRLSSSLTDWRQWVIAASVVTAGAFFRLHSAWLIVGGAVVGGLLF